MKTLERTLHPFSSGNSAGHTNLFRIVFLSRMDEVRNGGREAHIKQYFGEVRDELFFKERTF